jgi:hypothetical protein
MWLLSEIAAGGVFSQPETLANPRGSAALILSRDHEGAVVESKTGTREFNTQWMRRVYFFFVAVCQLDAPPSAAR